MSLSLRPRDLHRSNRPSATAQWTTFGRTLELHRDDAERIVTDYYAPVFLTAASRALLAPLRVAGPITRRAERSAAAGIATSALCRHAFIDERLMAALPSVDQVLILGAGYDSRAYRFADEIGDRPVYEVDLAPLSRRKAATVRRFPKLFAHASIHRVEIDFRTQSLADQLGAAGFAEGARTFVVWEGVSPYLSADAVHGTLGAVQALCGRGSVLAMDCWQLVGGGLAGRLRRAGEQSVALLGEPLDFTVAAPDAEALLAGHGFAVDDLVEAAALTERYATAGRRCDPGLYVVCARRR